MSLFVNNMIYIIELFLNLCTAIYTCIKHFYMDKNLVDNFYVIQCIYCVIYDAKWSLCEIPYSPVTTLQKLKMLFMHKQLKIISYKCS